MTTEKNIIHLIIDESQAKGYSNIQESTLGEIGVMAGYLIPDQHFLNACIEIEAISSKYFAGGKLHITDLLAEDQEKVRSEIYGYLDKKRSVVLYEAIYVQGFYQRAVDMKKILEFSKNSQRSKINISNNEKRELLHAHLFAGIFSKAIAFGLENIGDKFHLNIITDRTDDAVLNKFREKADELLNSDNVYEAIVVGHNPETGEKLKKKIITASNFRDSLDLSKITYELKWEDTSITFFADVISNSLAYYLNRSVSENLGGKLVELEAINLCPLSHLIYGYSEFDFADILYAHPKTKPQKI